MRMIAFRFVVLATAASASVALFAQTEQRTGSRVVVPSPAEIRERGTDEEKSLIVMREFAECTYRNGRRAVADALLLSPGDDVRALTKLATSQCLRSGKLRFAPKLFRGALFGELYRQRQSTGAGGWALPTQPLDLAVVPTSDKPFDARLNWVMLTIADCMHESHPDAVRASVLEPAVSPGYEAAFGTLLPNLGPCVPEGVTLKLNRMALEHAFGEYLYRTQSTSAAASAGDF